MRGLKAPRYNLVRFRGGFPGFEELQTDLKYRLRKVGQLKTGLIQGEKWNELALKDLEAINYCRFTVPVGVVVLY